MKVIEFPKRKTKVKRDEFGSVYDMYADKIYRFIYYKTYHREIAEDLTATTFLKALEHLAQYDPEKGSISSWLYRIARNLVTDHYRAHRKTVDIDDVWDCAGRQNVELDTENREHLRELQKVMKKLPSEQRDLLILRVWQELPYRDIAQIMGKSEGACKMMFMRVIARLRKHLSVAALLFVFLFTTFFQKGGTIV
ncbi:MAG: sigma-70 family RNA polymerase sigma factor [Spirochaetales bacterium]|nr:sigma-70 family RNA polymerase sigma factor [Spirochaetales bacterium]